MRTTSEDRCMVALILALWFVVIMGALAPMAFAQHKARQRLEASALNCARTHPEPSDINLVRCFTSRGLLVPGDL